MGWEWLPARLLNQGSCAGAKSLMGLVLSPLGLGHGHLHSRKQTDPPPVLGKSGGGDSWQPQDEAAPAPPPAAWELGRGPEQAACHSGGAGAVGTDPGLGRGLARDTVVGEEQGLHRGGVVLALHLHSGLEFVRGGVQRAAGGRGDPGGGTGKQQEASGSHGNCHLRGWGAAGWAIHCWGGPGALGEVWLPRHALPSCAVSSHGGVREPPAGAD